MSRRIAIDCSHVLAQFVASFATTQAGCTADIDTAHHMPLFAESASHCAPFGDVSGSYEIQIRARAEVESEAFGSLFLRIPEAALREHGGVVFDLACAPPTVGPDSPFEIPDRPTTLATVGAELPPTAPFIATCNLRTYASRPSRTTGCVPWSVYGSVEAEFLEELSIEIVALHDDETGGR